MNSKDGPIFRISIGQEKYDRIVSGRELPEQLKGLLEELGIDPVFQLVRQLSEKSGVRAEPNELSFEIYGSRNEEWAEYDSTRLLTKLAEIVVPNELNDQKPTLALRLGPFGNSFNAPPLKGFYPRESIKGEQIMLGSCFLATFADVFRLAGLIRPSSQYNGLLSTIHTSEGKHIPLTVGFRIYNNIRQVYVSHEPMVLGLFDQTDKLYPVVAGLQNKFPDVINEAENKLIYLRTPLPLKVILEAIKGDKQIMDTALAVVIGWQRFKF